MKKRDKLPIDKKFFADRLPMKFIEMFTNNKVVKTIELKPGKARIARIAKKKGK